MRKFFHDLLCFSLAALFAILALLIVVNLANADMVLHGPVVGGAPASILKDSYASGTTEVNMFQADLYQYDSSAFTAGSNYTLTSIKVQVIKVAAPTGNVTAYLYSSVAAKPSALLATSTNALDCSLWSTTPGSLKEWTFSGYSIVSGTIYHIVLYKSDYNSTNHCHYMLGSVPGNPNAYHSGDAITWSAALTAYQANFETYGY